jgi:predicted pyridoxine 5'-phosphate oxidase superfamily flavin-nucleotide-binding protein
LVAIPKEALDILNKQDSIKVLASADENGVPNAVFVGSITPISDDTLAFAEQFIIHTKRNLEKTGKAAVAVLNTWGVSASGQMLPVTAYQLKGTFLGFQTSGPLFDNFLKRVAEMRARGVNLPPLKSVGTIRVDEVFAASPGLNSQKIA